MKKTFLLLGLFILSLTMAMTSCNDPEPENNGHNGTINSIIIGDDSYEIKSAVFVADESDNDAEMIFSCNDLVFNIDLEGYDKIPTGTFELTREGRYTAEADMLFHDYDYEVTGALTISESSNIISVTISGEAYKDRASKKFSLSYQGEFGNSGGNGNGGEIPSGNTILINETTHPIRTALYYIENDGFETELTMTFIGETGPIIVDVSLDNINDLVSGTYDLTEEGLYQADVSTMMNDYDIIGELIVGKNGDIYNVTISGNAVDDDVLVPFALNYEGELFNANEPTGNGTLTINNVTKDINTGAVTSDAGMNMTFIEISNDIDSDYCSVAFVVKGGMETLVGTHQIGMDPMSGAIVAMEFLDQEYVGTTGELTIVKNGDVYTITANGTSMLGDFKTDIPFSCSYEGKLFEMK